MPASIEIIGNIGKDPDMKFTPSGKQLCKFSVAVTRKPKGGEEVTNWYNITAWEAVAEKALEFAKGNRVKVKGRFEPREYKTDSGEKRISLDVTAYEIDAVEKSVDKNANNDIPF